MNHILYLAVPGTVVTLEDICSQLSYLLKDSQFWPKKALQWSSAQLTTLPSRISSEIRMRSNCRNRRTVGRVYFFI